MQLFREGQREEEEKTMLNTVEFGLIRVVPASAIKEPFDSFIGQDLVCEWNFYQLASGEIVAVENEE